MFGSLIVQLESEHEGGELIVEHNGIVKKFCYATESVDKPAFVAFFSDCEHTLNTVTSGLRLVLAFNLVMTNVTATTTTFPQEELPSAVIACDLLSKYLQVLKSWEGDEGGPEKLVWKLEHQYTEANLCFSQLKGNDRAAVEALRSIRDSESGVELLDMHLVLIEKYVFWGLEGEVLETNESILRWVGLEGVVEFSVVNIDIETECQKLGRR